MLSLEYLIEEAGRRGLPQGKRRAIVREYIQTIILASIYRSKWGSRLYFMGGTCLRFCHRLRRFSEDLDFNAKRLSTRDFHGLTEKAVKDLGLEGLEAEYGEGGGLTTAYLNFPEAMRAYGITDGRGFDLMVKLEVNQPRWRLQTRPHVVSQYGYNYTLTAMAESSLITEKLAAMLDRSRGRDIYDLVYMLGRRFPFDRGVLRACGFMGEPGELVTAHLRGLGDKEVRRLANQVKPFLFREEDVELVLNAPEYAEKHLREHYL
jgi:hypothetical protein